MITRFPQHSFKNAIVAFTVGEKSLIMQLYADLKIDSKRFKILPNTPGSARIQLHWCIPFTSSFSCKHRETGERIKTNQNNEEEHITVKVQKC